MKILGLIGSPRKGGNTDLVIDQILKGAETKGYTTEKVYLKKYIAVCNDCRECKTGNFECTVDDDMQQIYPKMAEADVFVFGTPVYWYGPTAIMKMLLDRMRPFVGNKKLKGKRAIVVAPSAEGSDCCGPLVEMFRLSFSYLSIELVGTVLPKAYNKGEVSKDKITMNRAFELGASL